MLQDWALPELQRYQGNVTMPADFDEFWDSTLAASRAGARPVSRRLVETGLTAIDVYDVEFSGFGGERVKAWLRVPKSLAAPGAAIVEFVGYGGGRGHQLDSLLWSSLGYVHLVMDSRGQGAGWSLGATPDSGIAPPHVPGMMTLGVLDKDTYYYRRLMTDAALFLDVARSLPEVDASRIAAIGGSQGGGLTLAAAALNPGLAAAVARVPFLCDYRRAVDATDSRPFAEITEYLAMHRDHADRVFETLAYFDGVNFARRSQVPILMTVGLADPIVPASTVYAAFNNYVGLKQLTVWPYNGHESGGVFDEVEAVEFLSKHLA